MPACRRNLRTAATSPLSRRAARAAFGAVSLTVSDHLTRFALIGFRAEPVTPSVSCTCWRSRITPVIECAVSTTATEIARSPRKSSGRRRRRMAARSCAANPLQGVFSTRSPDRPNPIGLHRVRILRDPGRESPGPRPGGDRRDADRRSQAGARPQRRALKHCAFALTLERFQAVPGTDGRSACDSVP